MKIKIERIRGGREMAISSTENCANCGADSKCRRRDFSEQAWSVLLLWKEVQTSTVDQAICEDCYNELREVLIDRADEIEDAVGGKSTIGTSVQNRIQDSNKERKAS